MSAEVKPSMRVVPSGKVYRQMFDAQVQLTKGLSKGRREPTIVGRDDGIPLVRTEQKDGGHGLLTERQKTWVDGFPNDPHSENPVLYKQYTDYVNSKLDQSESHVAGTEVRGLPDVVLPARTGSDIIERIAKSRRDRHELAIEDMRHELGVISSEIEPRIIESGEMLVSRLQENDEDISRIMASVEKDMDLLNFDVDRFQRLWEDIQSQSDVRRAWIEELDVLHDTAESDRMGLVKEVFANYTGILEKISFLLAPELHKLLDRESQMINQTVLSNRRAYSDLYMRLMSADVEREKTQHTWWKRRVEDWKKLHTEEIVKNFKEFMSSEAIEEPPSVQIIKTRMNIEHESLNQKRIDIVESLHDFRPPASTKSAVYQWHQHLINLSDQLDSLNQQYIGRLTEQHENVSQNCLAEVDRLKSFLVESGVCTRLAASQVVKQYFLPLVGQKQKLFEKTIAHMEKEFEKHNSLMLKKLKSLFKYSQGAAHVWDIHEIGLAKQERGLQEKLENCRQTHDTQNQEREASLDVIMDRMRQDGSETSLTDSLHKALDMLIKIRQGYDTFHQQQMDIVQTYPSMVTEELDSFDTTVCKFFGVNRTHPDDAAKVKEREAEEKEKEEQGETTPSPLPAGKKKKKKSGKSRPGSRTSDTSVKDTPSLPMIVSEVLSTSKGTTFYVLTEAGEHGVPPDVSTDKEGKVSPTFKLLTETETSQSPDNRPEYILSSDVPDSLLLEVKKMICMNFLDYLEDWKEQAIERAHSVVAAKCEELNSELDLRIHLHQPRARRAELDIHNVRAAELVMHSERVSRHCKGIQQSLTDIRHQFIKMTQEHNKLATKFREDIESLEIIFINATKSSKLVALQNQLTVELEKFMSVIRTSLREFRKHLDETLSTLRESNARFIKSFKLFSDGGNFCPEEIEEYRKRLEKMSQKIDGAEGSIMLDLEGMESKRLDQATKVAMEFEDRFKSHMFDLIFMEKIARWLTNTQVKIKAEVANSNSQAQRLAQHVSDVKRRIDACEKPNPDKEQISPTELNSSLKGIFEEFDARSVYLNCVNDAGRPTSGAMQGAPALGGRVGFTGETTPISKPGKQPTEDPSVGVIKTILKSQKNKMRFGADAELDGERPQALTPPSFNAEARKSVVPSLSRTGTQLSATEKSFTRQSGRRGTTVMAMSTTSVDIPKRTQSALRRGSKATKWDRKYLVFGDKDEPGEEKFLLGIIRKSLREALDGLLTVSDLYYKQKGSRPVTRPQALQETFDSCTEVVIVKLQSYFVQAEQYHNQCLQELRGQLTELESNVSHIPPLAIREILKEHIHQSKSAQTLLGEQFSLQLHTLEARRVDYQNQLRPSLGHPQQREPLEGLCREETGRHDDYIRAIQQHVQHRQANVVEHAGQFLEQLARTAESQVLQYDFLLVVDDVEMGIVEPKKYPTSELIRRKNAGLPLEDEGDKGMLSRGKNMWPGLPANELTVADSGERTGKGQQTTASVTTTKTTQGHTSVTLARDQAYQDYKKYFESVLADIEKESEINLTAETRWTDSWNKSVEKVKQLYQ